MEHNVFFHAAHIQIGRSWKVQRSPACRWTWTFHPGVIGCTFKNRAARPSVTTKPRQLMCCYKDNSAFVCWWGLEIEQQGLIHWGCGQSGSHSLVLCHCSRALLDKGASQQMLPVNLFIPVPLCCLLLLAREMNQLQQVFSDSCTVILTSAHSAALRQAEDVRLSWETPTCFICY